MNNQKYNGVFFNHKIKLLDFFKISIHNKIKDLNDNNNMFIYYLRKIIIKKFLYNLTKNKSYIIYYKFINRIENVNYKKIDRINNDDEIFTKYYKYIDNTYIILITEYINGFIIKLDENILIENNIIKLPKLNIEDKYIKDFIFEFILTIGNEKIDINVLYFYNLLFMCNGNIKLLAYYGFITIKFYKIYKKIINEEIINIIFKEIGAPELYFIINKYIKKNIKIKKLKDIDINIYKMQIK